MSGDVTEQLRVEARPNHSSFQQKILGAWLQAVQAGEDDPLHRGGNLQVRQIFSEICTLVDEGVDRLFQEERISGSAARHYLSEDRLERGPQRTEQSL